MVASGVFTIRTMCAVFVPLRNYVINHAVSTLLRTIATRYITSYTIRYHITSYFHLYCSIPYDPQEFGSGVLRQEMIITIALAVVIVCVAVGFETSLYYGRPVAFPALTWRRIM